MIESNNGYKEMTTKFQFDVDSAQVSLTVVSGEAICQLYNTEMVRKSLFKALDRGIEMRFMAGPLVCIEDETNTLLDLIGKKNVEIYRRRGRALIHYRVMDHKRVYIEKPHAAVSDLTRRKPITVDDDKQEFWAKNLEQEFDYQIRNKIAERVYSKDDFLLLPKREIEGVMKKAEDMGKSFDFLTKEEIKDIAALI